MPASIGNILVVLMAMGNLLSRVNQVPSVVAVRVKREGLSVFQRKIPAVWQTMAVVWEVVEPTGLIVALLVVAGIVPMVV